MILVYSVLIMIVIILIWYAWKFVNKKLAEIDRDSKIGVVKEKMEDLKSKEAVAGEIKDFNKKHKGVDAAETQIDEFLNK